MRLQDRVAVVTGGAHGIGAAYCEGLAREGAHVVVADLDGSAARGVADRLSQDGPEALAVETDVADEGAVRRLVATVDERFGRADVLINNAAMFSRVPMSRVGVEDLTDDECGRGGLHAGAGPGGGPGRHPGQRDRTGQHAERGRPLGGGRAHAGGPGARTGAG